MTSKKKSTKITKADMGTRRVTCDHCPFTMVNPLWGLCKVPQSEGSFHKFVLAKNCPLAKLVYIQQVEEENPVDF